MLRVTIDSNGERLGSMFIDGSSVKVHAANTATADRFLETLGEVFHALQGRQRGTLTPMNTATWEDILAVVSGDKWTFGNKT